MTNPSTLVTSVTTRPGGGLFNHSTVGEGVITGSNCCSEDGQRVYYAGSVNTPPSRSLDGGKTVNRVPQSMPGNWTNSIACQSNGVTDTIYTILAYRWLWKSVDNGTTWTDTGVQFNDATMQCVAAGRPNVLKSNVENIVPPLNRFVNWNRQNQAAVARYNGQVIETTNGFASWFIRPDCPVKNWIGVCYATMVIPTTDYSVYGFGHVGTLFPCAITTTVAYTRSEIWYVNPVSNTWVQFQSPYLIGKYIGSVASSRQGLYVCVSDVQLGPTTGIYARLSYLPFDRFDYLPYPETTSIDEAYYPVSNATSALYVSAAQDGVPPVNDEQLRGTPIAPDRFIVNGWGEPTRVFTFRPRYQNINGNFAHGTFVDHGANSLTEVVYPNLKISTSKMGITSSKNWPIKAFASIVDSGLGVLYPW